MPICVLSAAPCAMRCWKKSVQDVDAATTLLPQATMALLEKAGIRAIPTGIAHGTVTAVIDGKHIEITTLRRDVATDGRHAEVAFTDDWEEDASRRDFTLNALYLSPSGELFDYFGGQADAKAGHVRFIGDPAARIAEDYLRILRFFRFHAHYGKSAPDAIALKACAHAAGHIESLSGERIQHELLKLLAAPHALSDCSNSCRRIYYCRMCWDSLSRLCNICTLRGDWKLSHMSISSICQAMQFALKADICRERSLRILAARLSLSQASRKALQYYAACAFSKDYCCALLMKPHRKKALPY